MKHNLLSILIFICCAITTQLLSQRVWAETTPYVAGALGNPMDSPGGMTVEQLKTIKAIKIANLDKDTYFKADGFILDRYEERPAYVFNYTDGITRKIYLYKVFSASDTRELGLLAVYKNEKSGETKSFVIPGTSANREAWDAYIDDLKYVGEKEPGLMSTLTFVLSREMAGLLSGGGAKTGEGETKKKEEYNFCFAPDAPITLADGSTKKISDIAVGEMILGYNRQAKTIAPIPVTRIDTHQGQFTMAGIWLVATHELTAHAKNVPTAPILLEATPNHPVLTATGESTPVRKALGDVNVGDTVYRYEAGTNHLAAYKVVRTEQSTRSVKTVYNLGTQSSTYLVNDTVVLDK